MTAAESDELRAALRLTEPQRIALRIVDDDRGDLGERNGSAKALAARGLITRQTMITRWDATVGDVVIVREAAWLLTERGEALLRALREWSAREAERIEANVRECRERAAAALADETPLADEVLADEGEL